MSARPDPSGRKNPAAHIDRAAADAAARLGEVSAAAGEIRRAELGAIAAAAVAHEVRNVLTPVRARLEIALAGIGDGKLVERSVREALKGIERAGRAAEAILSVVSGRVEIGDGADVAAAVGLSGSWVEDARFKVEQNVERGLRAAISQVGLEQVILNLLLNAKTAVGGAGTAVVRSFVETTKRGGREDGAEQVVVEVEDRGSGLERGSSLFGSYQGAASAGRKSGGVGLIICRHLVEAAGGSMMAKPEVSVGTTIRVELGRVAREATRQKGKAA